MRGDDACCLLILLCTLAAQGYGRESRHASANPTCNVGNQREQFIDLNSWLSRQDVEKARIVSLNPTASVSSKLKKPHFAEEPQVFQEVNYRKIEVYSAFYEPRPEASGPTVRIVAVGWQAAYNKIGNIYCRLWYEDRDYAIVVGPAVYNVIYPSTLFPKHWSSHFILCPLPRGVHSIPYAVAVTAKRAETASNHLMVLNRHAGAKANTHALCISALYNGFKNWHFIVEMFELHKLIGTSRITIYDHHSAERTRQTLRSFSQDDDWTVMVMPWKLSRRVAEGNNVFCQRAALNDCLYRSGQNHRFVTITDLDEVLMPRIASTWPQLMERIERSKYGEYLFQHSYFRRNTSDGELVTQTSFWRPSEVTPPGRIRSKAMYDAEKAISIDLHSAYTLVPGAEDYILPPDVGMLHHYRSYPMENFQKYPERYTFIEDRYAEKYKLELLKVYNARLKAIVG